MNPGVRWLAIEKLAGARLMDEVSRCPCAPLSWRERDGTWLAVLIILVATLRLWILVNTEVCARDSVAFVRYALTFEQKTWSDALLSEYQHPGYPVAVYAVSKPLRALWGTTPEVMALAAQIV